MLFSVICAERWLQQLSAISAGGYRLKKTLVWVEMRDVVVHLLRMTHNHMADCSVLNRYARRPRLSLPHDGIILERSKPTQE